MTLRRALHILETRGLITRQQGRGTFIAEPKVERRLPALFTVGMLRRGYKPGARIISFEQRPVEASLAALMGLPVSTPVYYAHRLRLLNEEPVMMEKFTIPVYRFPNLNKYNLSRRSVYKIMEEEYGVVVSRSQQSLEPVLATEYEAEWLGIKVGAPLMLERRLTFDQDGRAVEFTKDLYRGDRFRFVAEMTPLELE